MKEVLLVIGFMIITNALFSSVLQPEIPGGHLKSEIYKNTYFPNKSFAKTPVPNKLKQKFRQVLESLPCALKAPFEMLRAAKKMHKLLKPPDRKNPLILIFLIFFWLILLVPMLIITAVLYVMAIMLLLIYLAVFSLIALLLLGLIAMFAGIAITPVVFLVGIFGSVLIGTSLYLLIIQLCR